MENDKNNSNYKFFIYLSLFWITLAWGIYLLTLAGIFYWWSISLFVAIIAAGGARFIFKNLFKASPSFLIINLFLILTAVVFSFFSTPTIFSGRDQASISQAAIRLAQNGEISFSTPVSRDFFSINNIQEDKVKNCLIDNLDDFNSVTPLKLNFYKTYCQAKTATKAFNFPGFYYAANGDLVTQFPLAYISWLALFYCFIGLPGLTIANGFLLYFFFLSFYFIIDKLIGEKTADKKTQILLQMAGLLILLTSFCFMWFSKFTFTENMATPLLWAGILAIISLTAAPLKNLKNKKAELLLLFLSFGLLIFTRIEGIAFFIMAILLLIFNKNSRQYFKNHFTQIVLPLLIIISIVFIWNLFVDIYLYKSILKATLDNINENASDVNKNNSLFAIFDLFKIFTIYGIATPILFGIIGIFYLIKTKKYNALIPLFIILPSLFYILSPQITPDHPWMLRRFTFSILPAFILYSIILIINFSKKKNIIWGIIIFLIIISFNLKPLTKYLTFIPGKNLLSETQLLSQNFSDKDLILVDQLASGDNFEMIADPLNSIFNKNAVYFFNPQDLRRINTQKYDKIYLITPESKVEYYKKTELGSNMIFIKNYSLSSAEIGTEKSHTLSQRKERTVNGSIFEIIK